MKSKLRTTVEKFFADNKLSVFDRLDLKISEREEAEELCLLLKENLYRPKHAAKLLRAFQPKEVNDEVIEVLRTEGTPLLLELEPKIEGGTGGLTNDRLFLLKLLAMYGTAEGADRVVSVAKAGYGPNEYLWNVIFGCFTSEHPESERVFAEFKSALPKGFAAVSLLDAANRCAISGSEFPHPFDSQKGTEMLRGWLRDMDPEHFSYAHSATAALPFISNPPREELLQLAMDHADSGVSVEAAWAAAKVGMERGIRELSRYARDVNTAATAVRLLSELGREDAIPDEAQDPDFQAMAEMVNWLSHPNEFGEPPAKITLYDTRELFWPPTKDRRQLWLFRYEYPKSEHRDAEDIGLGMVGSMTFALFGETTADLTPLQAYAVHCCWELESNRDTRAPKKRSVAAGLRILAEDNDLPDLSEIEIASLESEEEEEGSEEQSPASKDMFQSFLSMVSEKTQEKRTAGEGGEDALMSALKGAIDAQVQKLKAQVEEFRAHLVAQRKAPPTVRTSVKPGPVEVLEKGDVARQRTAIESAGYQYVGVFAFENIRDFALVLFVHPGNGTIATISCGKTLTTEFAAEYPDGRGFYVRNTSCARGVTPAPWATYLDEPGRSVPELLAIFEEARPPGHEKKSAAQAVAELGSEFRRVQLWRMERGGWSREEVQAQIGITDPVANEDRLTEACLNVREKWLYAWFKDNHPDLGDRMLESLVIVHDEQESSILLFLWVMGGGGTDVRSEEFEGASALEAFRSVNEAHGRPLRLIARKTEGYAADFYGPAGE